MTVFTIIERTGYATAEAAESDAGLFRLNGDSPVVVPESDGTFMLRVYPAGFGAVEAATNWGTTAETLDPDPGGAGAPGGARQLMDYIAGFESGGNYNAFFGKARNVDSPDFSRMALGEVLDWQDAFVRRGSPSSAVGRYQFIRKTLRGLRDDAGLSDDTRFTPDLQDALAFRLMVGRGLRRYLADRGREQTFANALAMEWASLPVVSPIKGHKGFMLQPGQSYYTDVAGNRAFGGVDSFLRAVRTLA